MSRVSRRSREPQPCAHYHTDERGTRTGCVFGDVSGLSRGSRAALVLVSGRSAAFRVACVDQLVVFSQIGEQRGPPTPAADSVTPGPRAQRGAQTGGRLPVPEEILTPPNLTAKCNESHSVMHWTMRSHFNPRFHYELQIQKSQQPAITEQVKGMTSFQLLNPGTYTVKIRAQDFYDQFWSAWSSPRRVGEWAEWSASPGSHPECDQQDGPHTRAWRTSLLIALGTLLALLCAVLLCKRGLDEDEDGLALLPAAGAGRHLGDLSDQGCSGAAFVGGEGTSAQFLTLQYLVMDTLFPHIPHMKDPMGDGFPNDKLVRGVFRQGRELGAWRALWEVEAGGSLEARESRPAWPSW
ncbi:Interleukin-3 receptor subunit alpha [Plecturocebus cupreus]